MFINKYCFVKTNSIVKVMKYLHELRYFHAFEKKMVYVINSVWIQFVGGWMLTCAECPTKKVNKFIRNLSLTSV